MKAGLDHDQAGTPLPHGRSRRTSVRFAGAGSLVLAALLLSACEKPELVTNSLPEDGYRTRYPIVLAEAPETLDIPVGLGSAGLPESTRDNVRAFAAAAAEKGTGNLIIMAPSGSANETTAAYLTREIRAEARAGGLPAALIEVRPYRVDDAGASAPIRLTYSRIKAVSPPCGQWTGPVMPDSHGRDGDEFGCATQANLAAMVSNPNDLITPRATTPAPAWRRGVVLGNYGRGEVPSGSYNDGEVANSN